MPNSHPRQTRQDGPVCVLSGGVNRVGPTSAFCVGVRPAVALRRQTHFDTDKTQNAPVWRSSRLRSHRRHIRHDKTVIMLFSWLFYVFTCRFLLVSSYIHRCFITFVTSLRFVNLPWSLDVTWARFTKYLTTILRLCYDNARVTIDLRRTSDLQNIPRRMQGFSRVRFTWKIVTSSATVFAN